MFIRSVKSVLVLLFMVAATGATSSVADAGNIFNFKIGSNNVQLGKRVNDLGSLKRSLGGNTTRSFSSEILQQQNSGGLGNTFGLDNHARCNPGHALDKAYRMGVNNPHVTRVNQSNIVVKGYSHGNSAKVVFKRNSALCEVLDTRGVF